MLVHKETTVGIGNATPLSIIDALENSSVPIGATLKESYVDHNTVSNITGSKITKVVYDAYLVFEWDDEE